MKNQNTTPAMKFNAIQTKNHAMQQKMTHEMQPADLTKSYIDQGLISRFSTWIITCVITLAKASMPVVAAGTMASSDAATLVSFTPSASGTTAAPIVGMSAAGDDYLLTHGGATSRLPQNFTTNNQDTYAFDNPSQAKDAASFNADYHFQLDTSNFIDKVSITTGASHSSFNSFGVNGAFGIGSYINTNNNISQLSVAQQIGLNGSDVTIQLYDIFPSGVNPIANVAVNYDFSGVQLRGSGQLGGNAFLLASYFDDNTFNYQNSIFNVDLRTGNVLEKAMFGTLGQTNDLLIFKDRVAVGGEFSTNSGNVGIYDNPFSITAPIPEPSTAVLGGLGALGLAMRRKRTDKVETKYN